MRKRARTDLCGGRSAMVVPTATPGPKRASRKSGLEVAQLVAKIRFMDLTDLPAIARVDAADSCLLQGKYGLATSHRSTLSAARALGVNIGSYSASTR
jgi:hypothetical protein